MVERHNTIYMVVCACQDSGATGGAYRIGHIAMIEQHAAISQTVQIGCMIDTSAVGADGLGSMVISHDEDDIGLYFRHVCHLVWENDIRL